jgi:predicted transcriptional regulator
MDRVENMARAGRSMTEVGKVLGITRSALQQWLARQRKPGKPDKDRADLVHDLFVKRPIQRLINGTLRIDCSLLSRLLLIKLARDADIPDYMIADGMGISPAALSQWITRNAPWGIEDALSDYCGFGELNLLTGDELRRM